MPPTSTRDLSFRRDGVQLHVEESGPDEGTVLVLLHGGGLTAHTWDAVISRLEPPRRTIAYDLRGHGDSDWSPDGRYPLEDHVADAVAVVDRSGDAPAVVVGMSLGASIALGCAAALPDRVAGLVLVDGGPRLRREGSARIRAFLTGPSEPATLDEFVERAVAFNPRRDPAILRRSLAHNLRPTGDGRWTWKYDRRAFEAQPSADAEADWQARQDLLWSWARAIRRSTLVVRGADSDVFLADDADALVAAMSDARGAVIAGAGHTVQGDRPGPLAEEIDRFVAEVEAGLAR